MNNKRSNFYVEWWSIQKSTVYGVLAIIITLALLGGGVWWLWQNDWVISPPDEEDAPKDSAQIISFEGNVRIIRVTNRETERVTKTTFVQAGDTVQTQADGRAQIRMIDGSTLSVRPNSTVVISDSTSILGGTSVRVKLNDGQINVKTNEQGDNTNNIVEVKESENRVLSQTEASFNIDRKTNRGGIRISRGGVESEVDGEKVILKENEYAAIDNSKISSKEKLLKPPSLSDPSPSKQILSGHDGKASITFGWQKPNDYDKPIYHLQISESPFFVSGKMTDERTSLSATSFTSRNLDAGTYFWRIRASVESGQLSEWSDPSKFTIIKRSDSARIDASEWAVEDVGGGIYIVRGKTKSGAIVRILGRETFAKSDGLFRLQISTSSSVATIEIYDEKGNKSRYVLSLKTAKLIR